MKSRNEILAALARTEEERLLLAGLLDKARVCEERGYLTYTKILDLKERTLCTEAVRLAGLAGQALFWGGYEDSERGIYLFYPDYMDAEAARQAAPLALLRAHKRKEDVLTHRDYLGALMGLQIDRAMIGDILVHEQGADMVVLEEMADFILLHFARAGRKQVELTREPIEELKTAETAEKEGTGSVASPRLDSVAALVFGLGRKEAQERIERGTVFVNNALCQKPERQLAEGDRLTVRGLGRARLVEFGGVSRKGRQFIRFVKNA
ncbi:MAG: RNA-binding protein [Agathobaculum sp.]|uniref:RNA-binding protein n=1 Tax=Agathobaculum sp. TaxID=2048138 RepID=UPI003D901398